MGPHVRLYQTLPSQLPLHADLEPYQLNASTQLPDLKTFVTSTLDEGETFATQYIPAVISFLRRYSRIENVNVWEGSIALVAILMQDLRFSNGGI